MSSPQTTTAAAVLFSDRARYRVLETIADGPKATVLKARDRELDEIIVLKVLAPSVADDSETIARLKDEIKLSRRVRHPNVARVYDLEEWDGRLCITMEYIQGRNLEALLSDGPMPWQRAIPILHTVVLALRSAHEFGVVHRDLKPANRVLDAQDRPFLLDFGIAVRRTDEAVPTDELSGSPYYVPPECWRGVRGLTASDLYSLGVVGYEMIAGRPPFRTGALRMLMTMHMKAPVPPLRERVSDVPPALESLLTRMLAKRPESRPASAEVAHVLRGLVPIEQLHIGAYRGGTARILIVEDDDTVRSLMRELMARRGIETLEARDGIEGLAVAKAEAPDLIVLDVSMPGRDGVALLEELKRDPQTAGRPVVMLSGSLDPNHAAQARGLGAVAFLNKPLNGDVLDLVLDKYLS